MRRLCIPCLVLLGLLPMLSACRLQAADTAPPVQVSVMLVPSAEVVGRTEVVSFGLPLPPGTLFDASMVAVHDALGQEVPAHVRSLGSWRSVPPARLRCAGLLPPAKPGLRSVLIQFRQTFDDAKPVPIVVRLNVKRARNVAEETPVRSTWRLAREGTFEAEDGVYEPKVYALLSPQWLVCSNLTTLATLVGTNPLLKAFDQGQLDFFATAINDLGPRATEKAKINYKTDYEPWLYDRSQTFYNGYIRTGKLEFLREGHRAAQFYMKHLYTAADEARYPGRPLRGFFGLKNDPLKFLDAKYSYNECLATLYWLTGDPEPLKHLPDITAATRLKVRLDDLPGTKPELAVFTERNTANAILASLMEYEVTGAPALESYLRKGIDVLWRMQNQPAEGVAKNGAFNHYVQEAAGTGIMTFSPWMSSLLAHALLRTYHTLGDERIPGMLRDLAQAIVDRSLVQYGYGPYGKTVLWVPRYVATAYGDPKALDTRVNYRDACLEHAADVAYITALGAFFSENAAQRDRFVKVTKDLLQSHEFALQKWTRPGGWPENGLALHRLGPPRKYAWWYKNTSAIGWALGDPVLFPSSAYVKTAERSAER